MKRHEFLSAAHEKLQPRNYLEIGINDGRGLQRSNTRTIGVDPAFKITAEFECDVQMVKATSDDFFARPDAIARFPEGVLDFAFIDGMHLFEFALRDFMNIERLSARCSVVIFDDMLPRTVSEAARDRHTYAWAGDVYKVIPVLERYRPDLVVVPLDTWPTGLLLVAGLDPTNTVLRDNYDAILAEHVVDDPQPVPQDILQRSTAADAARVLDSPVWAAVQAARAGGERPSGLEALAELRGTASYTFDPPDPKPWPPTPAKPAPQAKPAAQAKPAGKAAPAEVAPADAAKVLAREAQVQARRLAGRARRGLRKVTDR